MFFKSSPFTNITNFNQCPVLGPGCSAGWAATIKLVAAHSRLDPTENSLARCHIAGSKLELTWCHKGSSPRWRKSCLIVCDRSTIIRTGQKRSQENSSLSFLMTISFLSVCHYTVLLSEGCQKVNTLPSKFHSRLSKNSFADFYLKRSQFQPVAKFLFSLCNRTGWAPVAEIQ